MIAKLTIIVRDAKGKTGSVRFFLNGADYGSINDPLSEILEYSAELTRRLDLIIMGRIVSASLAFDVTLPGGIKPVAHPSSDVEERARWVFAVAGGAPNWANSIPTFDHAFFPQGAGVITYGQVFADPDLAYLAQFLTAATDAEDWPAEIGGINDARGAQIGQPVTVYKVFKR